MLGSYTSRLLKEHLRAHGEAAGGTPTELDGALLVLDIAGSTAMSERFAADGAKGAERLAGILNLYFGDVFGLIAAHGGDALRIEGDAVLALWREEPGAQAAVLRAARGAIALRDAFVTWRPQAGVPLRHRISLGAGRITAASVRLTEARSFFVLLGQPLQATALLSHTAAPGEIVVTPEVAALLGAQASLSVSAAGSARLDVLHAPAAAAERSAATPPEDAPSLHAFVPRILVERAQAGHADWLAEFRMLSLVYVHLSGLDAAVPDAFAPLAQAVRTAADAVAPLGLPPHELVIGDKGVVLVVACGLPPSARENNAVRALEAATRIRTALARIGVDCAIGVGTGRAFCGDVGSAVRREYLVTGPVMYHAARLMQAAAGGIVVDDATARDASGYFAFSQAESLTVKGRVEPLQVHRLQALKRAVAAIPTTARGLHGRERELQQLLSVLAGARPGERSSSVAVSAEAGAGKTLLLAHLQAAAREQGALAMTAATSPVDDLTPYFVWRSLVPQFLGVSASADLGRRLLEALAGTPLRDKAALLADILPLALAEQGLAAEISGAARVTGIEDVIAALAAQATASRPLLVVVDDVHWLDDPSARLLLALVRRVPGVLLALGTRPAAGALAPHVAELLAAAMPVIVLAPLAPDSLARIVCDTLGVRSIPPRLAEFIDARAEGLPFYAEQLALSLRDQQLVEISDGRCRVTVSDLPTAHPGHKLEDVIVSRIDRLDSAQQLVLKVASAIGRVFDSDTLEHVIPFGAEKARLPEILASLVAAGLLEGRGSDNAVHAFRHVIVRDVTHDLLVHEKRVELHRQIAARIEQRHGNDLGDRLAELAVHLEEGARPDAAIHYRGLAAEAALRRHANHDALSHLDRIERLVAAHGLTLSAAQFARQAGVRADACHALSRFVDAANHFHACAEASGISIPRSDMAVAAGIAREMTRQGLHRLGLVGRATNDADGARLRLAAHIHARLSEQAYFAGDPLRILHGTLASLNSAERVGSVHEIIEGYGAMGIGLGTAGMHGAARFYRDRSLARAAEAGALEGRGIAHLFAAVYSFQAGEWGATLEHCRRGAAVCAQIGDHFRRQTCIVIEAYTELMLGRYAQAEAMLAPFGDDAADVENAPVRAWIFACRAILAMTLGRPAAVALNNLRAARDGTLHRAENLLVDGLEVAARLQSGEPAAALQAAERTLASMRETAPTMGIALLSVGACAEFFLARAEAVDDVTIGRARVRTARAACAAARSYARKTRIFVPRALLIESRLSLLLGRPRQARRHALRALAEAEHLQLPLEQALAHLALARLDANGSESAHRDRAAAILQGLGVIPSLEERGPLTFTPASASITAAPTA